MQFIVMAPNEWRGAWMNRQQLFTRIGEQYDVIYSNGLFLNWEMQHERYKSAPWLSQINRQDNVLIHESPKFPISIPRLPAVDALAKKLLGFRLNKALTKSKPTVLYIFHPQFVSYLKAINYDKLVYHAYDNFSLQGNYDGLLAEQEKTLLAKADVVIASSRTIKARLEDLSTNGQDIHFVPNGVNYQVFSTLKSEPADVKTIAKPRVGYTGAINRKVDLPLLEQLALKLPYVQFVVIGGQGRLGENRDCWERLKTKVNVHILGKKSVSEIASYMQHMDINIMIYKVGGASWAGAGYPLKLHEYLATGKPAISANIESVTEFSEVLDIAETEEEWINLISNTLAKVQTQQDIEARKKVAAENTWETRVKTILELID